MATTLVGAVLEALSADAALQAAFPALPVFRDEAPNEAALPRVILTDRAQPPEWVTPASRLEKHTLTATVYAAGSTAAGVQHPAEAIAGHLERLLPADWDVPLGGAVTVEFRQTDHTLTLETRRAPDKARVGRCVLAWAVTLGVG